MRRRGRANRRRSSMWALWAVRRSRVTSMTVAAFLTLHPPRPPRAGTASVVAPALLPLDFQIMPAPFAKPRHVMWIRPDAIGDNVLSAAMLPHIRAAFPDAQISVLCQEHIAALYEPCPFVNEVVTFNQQRFDRDDEY